MVQFTLANIIMVREAVMACLNILMVKTLVVCGKMVLENEKYLNNDS